MVVAVPPDRLADAAGALRPPRRRARRPRRVHRRRPPRRAPRRRRRARPRHGVPARRPPAAPDDRPRRRARPHARQRGRSPTRPPRCWPCSPTATSPPRRRRSTATTTRSAAAPSCARSSAPAGDGPGDGVVLADPRDTHGIAIGIGVNPWLGLHDPEAMAHAVVDEAIRNVVAVGADPDRVALLDNFSWGDPRRPSTLGELVAAVRGCHDAALAYGAPFVSGKDSLNNEYTGADGQRHAVPPTLVITAVAHVPDVGRCVTAELTAPGNALFLLGAHGAGVRRQPPRPRARRARPCAGAAPQPDPDAPGRYRRLHAAIRDDLVQACHDVSEGGLAVALAELCIAGRLGRDDRRAAPRRPGDGAVRRVDRAPRRRGRPGRRRALPRDRRRRRPLGTVTADPVLALPGLAPIPVADLAAAFLGGDHDRTSIRVSCAEYGMRAGPHPYSGGTAYSVDGGRHDAAGRARRRRAGDEPRHRRRAGARPRRRRADRRARRRADGTARAARRRPHRRRRRRVQLRRRARRRAHARPRPHRRRRRPPRRAAARVRRRRPARSSASATASRC